MKKRTKKQTIRICIGITLLCLILGYLIWGNQSLYVTEYTVSGSRLPDSFSGFRIVQISDLHNAEFGRDNNRLLNEIQSLQPDIIVITGDLVDSRRTDCRIAIDFARKAVQIAPTYFVPGNHEARIDQLDSLYAGLIDAGVTLLLDESVVLRKGDDCLQLIGILDPDFSPEAKIDDTITNLMPGDSTYTILLSHRPEIFETYGSCGVDLILTGHAHGGQFRLPYIGGLFAPDQGFFPKYDAGLFAENQTNMIVSRGIGNSLFPFRFNNRPEIVVITLQSATNS